MDTEERFTAVVSPLFADRPLPVRQVFRVLIECHGRFDSADAVAHKAGLRDRHELHRTLTAQKLLPLTDVARLLRVVWWSLRFEEEQITLSRLASEEGRYESQLSREVERALGTPWSLAKERGFGWVLERVTRILQRTG